MIDFIESLKQKIEIKKAIYFLFSMGMAYYEVPQKREYLDDIGYRDLIQPAFDEIHKLMEQNNILRKDVAEYLWNIDPYLAYLLDETSIETELVILSFLNKTLDIYEIFTVPLETLPDDADSKYGVVLLNDKSSANHQGVFHGKQFFYYSPLYGARRDAATPPPLIMLLTEQMTNNNTVSLRLDQTIALQKEHYKPFMRFFFEVYQGREINLDNIQFPIHSGTSEFFCVYNPETMKKVQFRISHRKDSERWIEVEELWDIHGREENQLFVTRYLHSIFNPLTNKFVHIDGSFNFYNNEKYKVRVNQQINAHANLHVKQWLVEGEISVLDWAKMILHFFDDPDLILDAFKGNLIEEVFSE
ncbi:MULTISPECIES: hypothetical protein [Paenibacillus]|uniref:WYL domain-containing protein n=1 Tax=Paenibacillus borealis TaxID=160799 RepID=A0ABX3H9U8_PAEBO|nr:hypothetical protein [Paenibacillus borealis]OMD47259.1 hypothetical protein BSK56_13835 [Paenibacillus borealis]